jgi:hypothetical protein
MPNFYGVPVEVRSRAPMGLPGSLTSETVNDDEEFTRLPALPLLILNY